MPSDKDIVDLEKLEPVSVAEPKAPELFEQWWAKHGDKNWSVKHAAREGWYACAESLGVYDD